MPPTLLLVEDDPLLADTLVATLATPEQQVEHIADGGVAAARLGEPHTYALVLLDLNLPTRSGLEVLATLRAVDRHTPVLILTARAAIEDRVKGLDLGADDYLAKPFALDELEARVRALLRRRSADEPPSLGALRLDPQRQRFSLGETPLPLPPREHRLLACLLRYAGEPVDKARLIDEAFAGEAVGDNAIEVYVHRLRRRLADSGIGLRTVRGIGYLLETQ
ncbi:response regulator transcription factor [Salinicola endophyticus]|uniref:Response regulator transcription factor n=1 Tax=Salinicola endophyticus TaxID=1949083 RepID=A0ABY8FKE2_9GAMM|nr:MULTISPECIES: response regulator transcription factor [Salinicola]WFF43274.1 response regulator transcription factor [Salinicola endophyticus]